MCCRRQSCFRGGTLLPWLRGLVVLALTSKAAAGNDRCNDTEARVKQLDGPKVADKAQHRDGQVDSLFSFDPVDKNVSIAVTPAGTEMDPDINLYARTAANECRLVMSAQDFGGDLLILSNQTMHQLNASRYYLRILCHSPNCDFHVSFITEHSTDIEEEIRIGETKSGIAYRGVPLHFFFNCTGECATAAVEESIRRLTFSVWPRDATSVHQLRLLVRKDQKPTTAINDHLKATRGWFSGEVVGTDVSGGVFHIVVIKRHGHNPMPFVLSVTLPQTVQQIPLGKPFFGAVGRDQMAFYKFLVEDPNTDIQVYLTKLDGDPDMAVSNGAVHSNPGPHVAQWHSRKAGDDEIVIPPDDPKRRAHPTGWFHVGVHGYKHTAFSLIALAETHLTSQDLANMRGEVIDWTELWLGLPQTLSAWPGHAGNFLFYSQLVTPRLFVQIQLLEGPRPDACMASCGSDPHFCPYISQFASPALVSTHRGYGAVSECKAGSLRGANGEYEVAVPKPCSSCWYALLVTSETVVNNKTANSSSKFRVLLGAEGRAHPLVAGESFRGHVDANDTAVLLVFDVPAEEVKNRTEVNATLRMVMTTIYGDPMFAVHLEGSQGGEDGPLLFASNVSGRDDFTLRFPRKLQTEAAGDMKARTYYIRVWAASKHARFRMQVFWELDKQAVAKVTARDFAGLGLPVLQNGQPQDGSVQAGKPCFFLYEPTLEAGNNARPTIRVTCVTKGQTDLRLWVVPVGKERESEGSLHSTLLTGWHSVTQGEVPRGWASKEGSNVLLIPGWDPEYVAPGSGVYAVGVLGETHPGKVAFTVEVSTEGAIEELPTTGTPRPGAVVAGEYNRYEIQVSEYGRSVCVIVKAISGDVDLYVGPTPSVSRGNSFVNSTMYGSDSVFIPAFDQHECTEEVISTRQSCSWYAAVLGVSKYSEYEISTVAQDGTPIRLTPNSDSLVLMPGGSFTYSYFTLSSPMHPLTLQVTTQGGALTSVAFKIVTRAKARRPTGSLARLSFDQADMNATFYAGVWSVRLEPKDLKQWCHKLQKEVKAEGGCVGFVSMHSADGYWGRVALLTDSVRATQKAPSEGTTFFMLEAGVPARGSLRTEKDLLSYGFLVSDNTSDLAVSLTPLTNCTPLLTVEFPAPEGGGASQKMSPRPDPQLHFVSFRISHKDAKFRVGLYRFWANQNVAATCEFDLRVQVDVSDAVADLSDMGMAAPLTLLLNVPVYSSSSDDRYFLFTSRIFKASDAAQRERLDVTFTVLVGELQVNATTLTNDDARSSTKKERLAEAFAAMKPVKSESAWGAPQLFSFRDLKKWCREALVCQLLLRVHSAQPGRYADYVAVATDWGSSRRPEVLLLGVPVNGCVGGKCASGNSSIFQLYVTNPSAIVRIRLTCQVEGSDHTEGCSHLHLSASASSKYEERPYKPPDDAREMQELEFPVAKAILPGQCSAPCVLLIYVEATSEPTVLIPFELSANTQDAYTLLIDGDEPVMRTVEYQRPEYFLFDSRRASPLLTLMVRLPYDSLDPHAELVSVYTLDCEATGPSNSSMVGNGSGFQDPLTRPSAEHFSYHSITNSRGQLLTFIRRGARDLRNINKDRHCYYRIAVISQRKNPVAFAIRGFDWYPASPLVLDEPLEGMVDLAHSFKYNLQGSTTALQVVLSLEVCSGSVRLLTSGDGNQATRSQRLEGGLPPTSLPLEEIRLLELESVTGRFSTYILTAEDPSKRVWLEPKPSGALELKEEAGGYTLTWPPALMFGAGQPRDGSGADLEYEVFYLPASESRANTSTPCGLYREYENHRAQRFHTKKERRLAISDLQPGEEYIFNVVAKSTTGQTVAYVPYKRFVMHEAKWVVRQGGASVFWGQVAPLLVMGISVAFLIFARPCCKGNHSSWRRFELELPSWERRARHVDAYRLSGAGNYAPPSVLGVAGTPYNQI